MFQTKIFFNSKQVMVFDKKCTSKHTVSKFQVPPTRGVTGKFPGRNLHFGRPIKSFSHFLKVKREKKSPQVFLKISDFHVSRWKVQGGVLCPLPWGRGGQGAQSLRRAQSLHICINRGFSSSTISYYWSSVNRAPEM